MLLVAARGRSNITAPRSSALLSCCPDSRFSLADSTSVAGMRAAVLAAVFACAASWSPHARVLPRTYLARAPQIGLRGRPISLLQPVAAADAAEEPRAGPPAAVWRHASLRRRKRGLEREFGIRQLLGYLWPVGGPRVFGVCKAKLMVSLSLVLLFSAKMFVVKVAAGLLRPLPWPAILALLPALCTAPAELIAISRSSPRPERTWSEPPPS